VQLQCPSGAPLRYAVCHTTCSSSSFLTAAIVSFTPLRSLLPSLRFAPLRHPFTSVACSTPAANNCARRRCHRLRYGLRLAQTHAYASMPRQSPSLCVHRSLRRFTVRPSRWRSQAIPFVPLSIAFGRLALRFVPTSVRHG
jgi:hypothetical protein